VELLRALGALVEDVGPEQRRIANELGLGELDAAAHTELFAFALYPYASVYLGPEGMLGGEARDRIAGFWRALGLTPPAEPDHLATLLAFYAGLCEGASQEDEPRRRAALERARAAFFWEHLASWLPVYLAKARPLADDAYGRWTELLNDALEAEGAALEKPETLPLHLRAASDAPPVDAGDDAALLAMLLAPVRAGFILTRADLRELARAQGIALRQGERRYALGALLAQDPASVRRTLRSQAEAAAGAHASLAPVWNGIGRFWEARARATVELL
jgi:TorA maturation chaperone TorD